MTIKFGDIYVTLCSVENVVENVRIIQSSHIQSDPVFTVQVTTELAQPWRGRRVGRVSGAREETVETTINSQ